MARTLGTRLLRAAAVVAVAAVVLTAAPAGAVHQKGLGWAVVPTPNVKAPSNTLYGVSCVATTSCVAVGDFGSPSGFEPLSLVKRGTSWSIVPPRNPSDDEGEAWLNSVSCVSPSWCMAVGGEGRGSLRRTLIERWNGSTWSTATTGTVDGDLASVRCLTTSWCMAVGSADVLTLPVAELFNGKGWIRVGVPGNGADNELESVSCASPTFCMAVGSHQGPSPSTLRAESYVWKGSSWSLAAVPAQPSTALDWMYGVACPNANECLGVGAFSSRSGHAWSLGEAWSPGKWTKLDPPSVQPETEFGSVWCATSSCVVVGADGRAVITMYGGGKWSPMAPYPVGYGTQALESVSCLSPTVCTTVGSYEKGSSIKTFVEITT